MRHDHSPALHVTLASIDRPSRALVVGASGGVGAAFHAALRENRFESCGTSRGGDHGLAALDILDETSIAGLCETFGDTPPLRLAIIASGLLHDGRQQPEKTWRALDAAMLARSFAVNAIGPALVAKHVLPRFPREGKSVFAVMSARVGSIEDNRLGGWYGYRASKAALNQFVRTLAIEARRTHPAAIIVALHPGTVATPLSAPFRGQVAKGALFTPSQAAAHLLEVIDGLGPDQTGGFFAWDGTALPF